MTMMTDKQAYAAMFYYLEQYYNRGKSDEIGWMLGDMSLLEDGSTADSAVEQEWQEAVDYALKGGEAGRLVLGNSGDK